MQVELSEVRVLFKLLGLLLSGLFFPPVKRRIHLTCRVISVYNVRGVSFSWPW